MKEQSAIEEEESDFGQGAGERKQDIECIVGLPKDDGQSTVVQNFRWQYHTPASASLSLPM